MKAIFLTLDLNNYYLTIRDKQGGLIHYEMIADQTVNLHETIEDLLEGVIDITSVSFSKTSIEVIFDLK